MPYIQTPPTVHDVVIEGICNHRSSLGGRYVMEHSNSRAKVGEFTAVADATVEVQVLTRFSLKRPNYSKPEERVVQFGAAAQCHGHGCVEPQYETPFTPDSQWDSDEAEDHRTAETALPVVQKAKEWAQAHAEKCRAQPYNGR
ncbi:hypothetical protein [Streptomyces decoyicus]|uniref:hypothetical protein n=1 Tax=Streptomyces decoyicus TaxID=249567 RepID=UPI00365B7BAC